MRGSAHIHKLDMLIQSVQYLAVRQMPPVGALILKEISRATVGFIDYRSQLTIRGGELSTSFL